MYKVLPSLLLLILLLSLFPVACDSQNSKAPVSTGIDVLIASDFRQLEGKKIGLITNPTGVNADLISTIDILYTAPGLSLRALFGPEHGVRGDHTAGEKVYNKHDPKTGLPVYSLYGKTRKPTPDMLEGLDLLVYDIQDIGCRSYTYISTMALAMEAAAEQGIPFMVLDRPNPLGGHKVEGPIAQEDWFSLVGAFPIPYVYGLTCGELATMINEEGWLAGGVSCDLQVIEMHNWTRDMDFEETGLHWVPSSPHIPDAGKAPYYVATGILGELGLFNIGVGYTLPFEILAHESLNPDLIVDAMNRHFGGKVLFRPMTYKPYYGKQAGQIMRGLQIYIVDAENISLMSVQFKFLEEFHRLYPTMDLLEMCSDRHNMFDKVNGGPEIRQAFFSRYRLADIEALLYRDVNEFRERSRKYYRYR